MYPIVILNGILMGTSVAIFLGLAVVLFIYFLLAPDYPNLRAEFEPLIRNTLIFAVMSALTVTSFLGMLLKKRWRWLAEGAMFAAVAGVVIHYLPA